MSDSSSNPHGTTTNVDKCLTEAKPREGGGVVATYAIETPRTTVDAASLNESYHYIAGVMQRAFPDERLQFIGGGHVGKNDVMHFVIPEGCAAEHVRYVMASRAQSGETEIS